MKKEVNYVLGIGRWVGFDRQNGKSLSREQYTTCNSTEADK